MWMRKERQKMEQMNQAYKVFTRICLNNWHYIDRKVLGLNESINFLPVIPEVEINSDRCNADRALCEHGRTWIFQ